MNVVGYTRVSTQGQVAKGESLAIQKNRIQKYCELHSLNLLQLYSDKGISGASAENRPAFISMIEDAKAGKFKAIVFCGLSRFARNTKDILTYQAELKEAGVSIVSIDDNINTSGPSGDFMLTILSAVVQLERETIRETMYRAKIRKWKDGRMFNGVPPYGYRWDKSKNKLVPVKEEREIYQRIVKMYLDQGMSLRDIVLNLENNGIPSRRGKKWSNTVLSYILKNTCYYGEYYVNRHVYEKSNTKSGIKRSTQTKPRDEWIKYEIEPFISKLSWERIQDKTKFNTMKSKRSTWSTDYWLRDVLICGECGGKVKHHKGAKRKDGTYPRYYTCYWAQTSQKGLDASGHKRCSLPWVKAEALELRVWRYIRDVFARQRNNLDCILPEMVSKKALYNLESQFDKLTKKLDQNNIAREQLWELFESKKIESEELAERLNSRTTESDRLTEKIELVRKEIELAKDAFSQSAQRAEFLRTKGGLITKVFTSLGKLGPTDRKRIIESLLDGPITLSARYPWESFPRFYIEPARPRDDQKVVSLDLKLRFNEGILEWLQEEGKLNLTDDDDENNGGNGSGGLDKNSPHGAAAADLRRGVQR